MKKQASSFYSCLRGKAFVFDHWVWYYLWVFPKWPLLCEVSFLLSLVYWVFLSWKGLQFFRFFFATIEMIMFRSFLLHPVNVVYYVDFGFCFIFLFVCFETGENDFYWKSWVGYGAWSQSWKGFCFLQHGGNSHSDCCSVLFSMLQWNNGHASRCSSVD